MLARAAAWLDRAAFNPTSLPDDLVTGIALAPAVIAGLVIFKFPALQMLLVALVFGVGAQLVTRWVWRKQLPRPRTSPIIAAIFGVALVGAGAPLIVSIEIAIVAVTLEVLRAYYIPAIRAQPGLIAFAAITLLTRGATLAYLNPITARPFPDPIAIWYLQPALPSSYDPITLYVGNVAGPVFATSLLAVAVGIAWLAYARRLSVVVIAGFLGGSLIPIALFHWDFMSHLVSGPTWFVAGLLLADRRLLPGSWAIRPVLGFAAGMIAVGLRLKGYGIEAALMTVAGIQALMAIAVILLWAGSIGTERMQTARRLRQRKAQLRVVKTISRAS